MYRCQVCGKILPARTTSFQITVKTRCKSYPFRSKANGFKQIKAGSLTQTSRWESRNDPGGQGREIVKETRVCPACYQASKASI